MHLPFDIEGQSAENSHMKLGLFLLLLAGFSASHARPELPPGYEVGENTTSPDGQYAVLFPERDDAITTYPPNLLVQLDPYRELAKVCEPGLPPSATTNLQAEWNGNNTVALWHSRRWGIVDLKVYELAGNTVTRVHPIWDAVREVFRRDFRDRFLSKYPDEAETIIFISDESESHSRREFTFQDRQVLLDIAADNKPNLASGPHWTASLRAVWNLHTGKLENVKFRPGEISVRP